MLAGNNASAALPFGSLRRDLSERSNPCFGSGLITLVPFIKESLVLALVLAVLDICQAALFTISHTRVMKAAEGRPTFASLNISGGNIGIALGAFIGSRVIDLFGLASVGLAGAVIIVAAMAATLSLVTAPHRLPQLSGATQ
jgi:DHA1 family inner membrane transport protein